VIFLFHARAGKCGRRWTIPLSVHACSMICHAVSSLHRFRCTLCAISVYFWHCFHPAMKAHLCKLSRNITQSAVQTDRFHH
jgi:hypothetical protein